MVRGEAGLWGAPAPSGSAGQMNSRFCEGAAHFLSKAHVISPEQTLGVSCPIPSPPGGATSPSPWVPSRLPLAQGSPPRAPSNCSVTTPARRVGRTPGRGGTPGLERGLDSPAQVTPGALLRELGTSSEGQ